MSAQMTLEREPNIAVSSQSLQTVALAIVKIIENITTQGQINSSVVARLLELERKIEGGTKKRARRAGPRRKR